MRCWGRRQRTTSAYCPSSAQNWGRAASHPYPRAPAQLAGTAASRDAAAAAQVFGSLQRRKAPGDRQDQTPRAEWCCPTMTVQLSLLHCLPWPWSSQEPKLCPAQQWKKQQQRVLPHPYPWVTTAGKNHQKGVFHQCCLKHFFLPSQLKLSNEPTELLKIKNSPLAICPFAPVHN